MFQTTDFLCYLPPTLRRLPWRAHPLDGKLLLFERNSGLNVLLEGEETRHLRRQAPRTLLLAVTNHCNLRCAWCYRDQQLASTWTFESLLAFCQQADTWGVLEVAFGGGEPTLFPHWAEFIRTLHATTGLAINFTTNGLRLDEHVLHDIAGHYGQIRLSMYDTNNWQERVQLLAHCDARFGVNWLITPQVLPNLETTFALLQSHGVRDVLLLRYKGTDMSLHLAPHEMQQLELCISRVYERYGPAVQLKLDSCWGNAMPGIPHLFTEDDCGAGDDFLSITSDQQIKPCSFHHVTIPFTSFEQVQDFWHKRRQQREAARLTGCARLPMYLDMFQGGHNHARLHLAAI